MSRTKSKGFTLIELMIVVAVVAILAMIALPSYTAQVRKSRRSDAISTMNTVVLAEERWRTNCSSYVDFSTVCPPPSADPTTFMSPPASNYYKFTLTGPGGVGAPTAAGYQLNAAAIGDQAKDQQFGTPCATLTIASGTGQGPAACFGH